MIFVGPARTGKTIGLIDGWISYSIISDPSDFLLVQLTQEKASEHSRKDLIARSVVHLKLLNDLVHAKRQ